MKERIVSRQNRAGMTLVEVLVALTILSVALLVYVDLLAMGNTISRKADLETQAAQIAMDRLTQIEQTAYPLIQTDSTNTFPEATLPNGALIVRIGPLDGNASNLKIRQIDVTVVWSNAFTTQTGGRVRMTSLVSAPR